MYCDNMKHLKHYNIPSGIFIPEFRLYGLEKTTDETTVKYYDETQYVERKANHRAGSRLGCEVGTFGTTFLMAQSIFTVTCLRVNRVDPRIMKKRC